MDYKEDAPQDARIVGLTKGRMVHYTPEITDNVRVGEPIVGVIVRVHTNKGTANLRLLLDLSDDVSGLGRETVLVTLRRYSEEPTPGTWRFIPRA